MKTYFVLMHTKHFSHTFETNSLRWARRIADMKIWKYSKIHYQTDNPYRSQCIYINKRES